ncbi:thiamine pyrophosphate-binding protein [bacterium]|nr:thiamine pyrophosphate-binding protein [bacterium]
MISFLADKQIGKVFGIAGGASLHLLDSIDKSTDVTLICNHHEQHSAMAADAYARASEIFGVVIATSGPGATNLVTGVCGAYYDSIPLLCLTGQVSTWRQVGATGVRQIGFQEIPTVNMFRDITKYSVKLEDPEDIRFELEKALHMMSEGRPGPVLIDIPDNLQRENIDINNLRHFNLEPKRKTHVASYTSEVIEKFNRAKRPVILLGAGASIPARSGNLEKFLNAVACPIVTTWGASDFVSLDNKNYIGNIGTHGNRLPNFVVQNSDYVLSVGARLDTKATGTPLSTFARCAFKIMVDIDKAELNKFEHFGMTIDLKICEDSDIFIRNILSEKDLFLKKEDGWIKKIESWEPRLAAADKKFRSEANSTHTYRFFTEISALLQPKSAIVSDTGCALAWLMQTFHFKKGQRFFHDFNNTAMGWSLPAVTGIFATGRFDQINCFVGDGSLMMSIQELAVIKHFQVPVNIFLINNFGYSMIKQTQEQWLESRFTGSDASSDLSFPDFSLIASAFGLKYIEISAEDFDKKILLSEFLDQIGPKLINVIVGRHARVLPQVKFGRANEDMEPLLDDDMFADFMLVPSLRGRDH